MDQWINEKVWIDFASEEMDCVETRTHQLLTIDIWVTLSITAVMATQCGERNDFMSEKICCWIQLSLVVRDLGRSCSLVEGWAINLRLTSHWSRELRERAFIKLNRLSDTGEAPLFRGSLQIYLVQDVFPVLSAWNSLLFNFSCYLQCTSEAVNIPTSEFNVFHLQQVGSQESSSGHNKLGWQAQKYLKCLQSKV